MTDWGGAPGEVDQWIDTGFANTVSALRKASRGFSCSRTHRATKYSMIQRIFHRYGGATMLYDPHLSGGQGGYLIKPQAIVST